jgi:hypothetical protein
LSVWYVFWLTPQHMPLLLLDTTPPTMHESMDEGSGPILYWIGSLFLAAWPASSRLTSPRMRPGSTVMLLPSPWGCGCVRGWCGWRCGVVVL